MFYNRARWIKFEGIEHRKGEGVICALLHDQPVIGEVKSIYVVNYSSVYLEVTSFETYFDDHYRVYILHNISENRLVSIEDLLIPVPVFIREVTTSHGHSKCFILPYHIQELD